jgi:hypothetical protein
VSGASTPSAASEEARAEHPADEADRIAFEHAAIDAAAAGLLLDDALQLARAVEAGEQLEGHRVEAGPQAEAVPGPGGLLQRRRAFSSRSMRRFDSRSAMSRRLSRPSLPRASASSTLARPSLK